MYIYTIKNLVNGKMYVGQTIQTNAKMRWYSHCDMFRKGKKSYLYDSMRKHGIENFLWEVVDQTDTIEKLNKLETEWANKLRAQGITLYNNRETGGNKLHSVSSIEKMRQAKREEHARRRVANGGVEQHSQHKPHVTGWKNSEQGKLNKSIAQQKRYAKLTEKITLTDEHKQKVREGVLRNWAKRKMEVN
jgi:group I intron endonuclease